MRIRAEFAVKKEVKRSKFLFPRRENGSDRVLSRPLLFNFSFFSPPLPLPSYGHGACALQGSMTYCTWQGWPLVLLTRDIWGEAVVICSRKE